MHKRRWLSLAVCLVVTVVVAAGQTAPSRVAADEWRREAQMIGAVDAAMRRDAAIQAGVGWDRVLFLWQEIQPNGPDDWEVEKWVDQVGIRGTLESGLPIVAVIQGTPDWAAGNPDDHPVGVPKGLNYSVDDAENTFGQFMQKMATYYKGHVQAWVIGNEPDLRPGQAGDWWTWAGNTEDFFKMVRSGYLAVKKVDPDAQVVFAATTYFADATQGRELFLERALRDGARDPDAARNQFYFDAVAVNLYCSPRTIYEVHQAYTAVLAEYGLRKPIWLTETNCPVYNDAGSPIPPDHHITTTEQAAYLLQAVAMARAAGYQRVGWYGMVDHDPEGAISDRWGLLRPDDSPRPAYKAFQVATRYLGNPNQVAQFAPLGLGATPGDWQVWRVVLDELLVAPSRVQVLWRSGSGPDRVVVEATGNFAYLVDMQGRSSNPRYVEDGWEVPLPPTRVRQPYDPPGYPDFGNPVLLVETGFPTARSLEPPRAAYALDGPVGTQATPRASAEDGDEPDRCAAANGQRVLVVPTGARGVALLSCSPGGE